MDWKRLREELATCRLAADLNQTKLARRIGIAKSTVNRIENVSGEPDHVPNLDTIERWVLATGLKLSGFFLRIEVTPSGVVGAQMSTGGSTDASSSVASPAVIDENYVRRIVTDIVERSRRTDRERKAAARTRQKSKRRERPRTTTRRRG